MATPTSPPITTRPKHIGVLDPIRGLAALAVCVYHFTNGNEAFLPSGDPLRRLGYYGHYGVEAFFVVSGFVIPYSQLARNHRLADFGPFMVRRLKRLEPPYLTCVALSLGLAFLSTMSPGFRGSIGDALPSLPQLAAHVAYANAFLGFKWINPVFWTLAIEFQFYILMACAFQLVAHSSKQVRLTTTACLAGFAWLGNGMPSCIPHWLPVFLIGITTFQAVAGLLSAGAAILLVALIGGGFASLLGAWSVGVAVATALAILCCARVRMPQWISPVASAGVISYSLYLLHVPIGMRVINASMRFLDSTLVRYAVVTVALFVSIASAWLFWRLVEKPSAAWAKAS
jgi:peptidoglycan/LPS O-acetylase OafA/YrhL